MPRKSSRAPSAPSKPPYLVSSRNPPAPKNLRSPQKRSSTPNPFPNPSASAPAPKSDSASLQAPIGSVLSVIKKNKLLTRQQLADIEKKGSSLLLISKRIERLGQVSNQMKSGFPKKFWDQWNDVVQLYSKHIGGLNEQLTQRLKSRHAAVAAKMGDAMEKQDEQRAAESCFSKLKKAMEIIGNELESGRESDVQSAVALLNEVNIAAPKIHEFSRAITSIRELTQCAVDYSNMKMNCARFKKQLSLSESELKEKIYVSEEWSLQQSQQFGQKGSVDDERVLKHVHEIQNDLDEPKIAPEVAREILNLGNQNGEKKRKITAAKEEKRQVESELAVAKDANARNALSHQSTVRTMRSQKQKVEKAQTNVVQLRKEIAELTKYRDELKASVDNMTFNYEKNKNKAGEQPDDKAQEENRRLTEELTKARAEKIALEEEWLRMKAIGNVLISSLPPQNAKPYIENDRLRDEYVRISRQHLALVESSLRQNYSNDRARILGEMETNKKLQISYRNASISNQSILQEVNKLKEERDQLQNTLENAILERYTAQAEYAQKGKGKNGASLVEKNLLNELQAAKDIFTEKKAQYLKELQHRQNTSITNMCTRTSNQIADLRSAAFDTISESREQLKSVKDQYSSLQQAIELANRSGKTSVTHNGMQLSFNEASDQMESLIEAYRTGIMTTQQVATEEAKQEIAILAKSSDEFEANAKKMIEWTGEVYATLLQTQARVQTLRIEENVLTLKSQDPSIDVEKCLEVELKNVAAAGKKSGEVLSRVKVSLKNLLAKLNVKATDSMSPEEMMEIIDATLKERQSK